jgi:hypothetical protein
MPIDPATLVKSLAPSPTWTRWPTWPAPWTWSWSRPNSCSGWTPSARCSRCRRPAARASASDPLAQALEDHQETLAAGPCLDAFTSGQPAIMHDAALESRWERPPGLCGAADPLGLSVPIQLGGGPIGTLDVYPAAPRAGMQPRSAPCRPMPAGRDPARHGGQGRTERPAGRATQGRAGRSAPASGGQARTDGSSTAGRPAGPHRSAANRPVLQAQAAHDGRRGRRPPAPACWSGRAGREG